MIVDIKKSTKIKIQGCVVMKDGWEGEPGCKVLRYTHGTNVDPQDSLCRVVCPVS